MLYLPALSVCAVASLSRRNCKQKMTLTKVKGTDQQCIQKKFTQGLILRLVLCKKCHWYSYLVRFLSSSSKSHFYLYSNGTLFFAQLNFFNNLKGTVSWDRFQKCWRKWTELGLNKGRGWFLNFLETPLIFNWNKTSVSR
jgi:hypothetical protein